MQRRSLGVMRERERDRFVQIAAKEGIMRVAYLCVLAGLMVIMVGARLKQAPPDLSSPKATVQSLLEAYSKHDFAGMAQCVAGGKAEGITDFVGTRMLPFTNAAGKNYIVETNGDTAKVGLEIDLTADVQAQRVTITLPELLTLKKADVGWQIVADKISIEKDGMSLQMRPLKLLIAMLDPANRQVMEAAHAQAESASCLSNVKQLGLGAMMYTQDYDDVLPRRAAEYKNLLFPYVKNEAIFHCALDAKGTIS